MVEQALNESTGGIAGPGMNAEPFRLVQGEQMVVFEKDIEDHCFGAHGIRSGIFGQNDDPVADGDGAFGGCGNAIDENPAILDQVLKLRARKLRKAGGEVAIEPLSGTLTVFHLQGNHLVV